MKRYPILIIFILFTLPALCADQAASGDSAILSGWWLEIVSTIILGLLAWGMTYLRGILERARAKADASDLEKAAIEALLQGMAETQNEFVRGAKEAKADGRLTLDEIKTAEKMAWDKAKGFTRDPAVKRAVLNWTEHQVSSLIKLLLARVRAK